MNTTNTNKYEPHVGLQKVIPRDGEVDKTEVDIIAIHGLDTDSPRTWTYKGFDGEINWLESFLPEAVPHARIYTYNWDAKVFNNAPVESIFGQAERLLTLVDAKHGTSSRPILFIASCFGGLILTEAINRAAQVDSPYRHVLEYTVGIVFLATPFAGTDAARKASWLAVIQGIMGKNASNKLIKDLEKSDGSIRERVKSFAEIANSDSTRLPLWFFYETKKTQIMRNIVGAWFWDWFFPAFVLVEENSACIPGFKQRGLGKPHSLMNKFDNRECSDYIQVESAIVSMLDEVGMRKKQRAQFLASLNFTGMNERRNDSHMGTFPWIFDSPPEDSEDESNNLEHRSRCDFEDWLRSNGNTYWISGKPGSGKTTLMKYLIDSPRTKEALSCWAKNCTIICHFFWKYGSLRLQNNLKGCLCSIIHQVLECGGVSFRILPRDNSLSTKRSVTDWSRKELGDLCLKVLSNCRFPVCIFLDGLDEICIEDRDDLLELVQKLQEIPDIKLCLASRPEFPFISALSMYPQLRLQDLTSGDMRKYASKSLQPHVRKNRLSESVASDITERVTRKANGVFLWLRLAVSDLCNGLPQYRDSDDDLYTRIDQMPAELNALYEDIWTRINKDSAIYRKDAALYFKIAIASRDLIRELPELNILHLMATTTRPVQDSFLNTLSATYMEDECKATIKKIVQRCIGLLEIVPSGNHTREQTWNPQYASLLLYWKMKVQFTHRTAYDFFMDSDKGKNILDFDSTTSHDLSLRLLKSDLIMIKLIKWSDASPDVNYALDRLSWLPVPTIPREKIDEILVALKHLYDNGYYYDPRAARPHFLAVAAHPSFREFVLSNIESSRNPSSLATDVLRYKSNPHDSYLGYSESSSFPNVLREFWEPLRNLEADPSRKGICFPAEIYETDSEMPFRSPTGNFLFEILQGRRSGKIDEIYSQLERFSNARPNLQERIPFLLALASDGLYIESDFGEITLDSGEYDDSRIILVLEVKFLLWLFSERARRREMTPSTGAVPHRAEDTPSDTYRSIALLGFKSVVQPKIAYYQCSSNATTEQLLNILVQFLLGNWTDDLDKEVSYILKKIEHDIIAGSSGYTEIEQDLTVYLAERDLGWCFVDDDGIPIRN
ncbi:hypothetical protein F4808DRAFT_469749 [Astrocystis sublimbata]|nr:hypothetical protein F4808DRAFT_469749 [Astrocystis sublimbata]